jgi:UDP-N-acetylmuramoyl-L-alanyl-D-glutamate--2,6-diaminopimelate ligase
VTGTNGKTTTTSMIASIVEAAGEPWARITTLGAWVDGEQVAEEASVEAFGAAVRRALEAQVRTIAIEATSRALAEGFAHRWPAEVGVFTNLSRDHLDYHGTPERYLGAKAQLFLSLPPGGSAVLNAADEASALLEEVTPRHALRRGFAGARAVRACASLPLELAARAVRVDRDGTLVELAASPLAERLGPALRLRVVGDVHADNALAAALASDALGYPAAAIRAGLERFAGVPGRFQLVARYPLVVVDYAHTPDALARTLRLARRLAFEGEVPGAGEGRVLCVFGCGGERDAGKRAPMGRLATELADVAVLTTDNPRGEDARAIEDQVAEGAVRSAGRLVREPDRVAAITMAVGMARRGDVVVVAGRGHERVQRIGSREVALCDAQVARDAWASRFEGKESS